VHEQVGLGAVDRGVRREPPELLVDPEPLAVGAAWIGAVLKLTRSVWPTAPSSPVNEMVAS
jgi:hypothetical protein